MATCSPCQAGYYCPTPSTQTPCPAGTYSAAVSATSSSICSPCPAGAYCLSASAAPTACLPGTYNSQAGGSTSSSCLYAPAGTYTAGSGATAYVNCSAGTYHIGTGGSACTACATGTYGGSAVGLSTPCAPCAANSYCTTPTSQTACPANTYSAAGTSSQLNCSCSVAYTCTYTKSIKTVVTLVNITLAQFNNNTGGVRTAFLQAIALAAGVPVSTVTITNTVALSGGNRRLLLMSENSQQSSPLAHNNLDHPSPPRQDSATGKKPQQIDVYCSISGASGLADLQSQLTKRKLTMRSHEVAPLHSVTARRVWTARSAPPPPAAVVKASSASAGRL